MVFWPFSAWNKEVPSIPNKKLYNIVADVFMDNMKFSKEDIKPEGSESMFTTRFRQDWRNGPLL